MNPIRSVWDDDRRKNHRRAILIAFWSVLFVCVVVSTGSLIVAYRATTSAGHSEDGFCIAINLIEGGALSDAKIAKSPGVSPEVKRIRTHQYQGALHFALQLRQLGFRCKPPPVEVIKLVSQGRKKK